MGALPLPHADRGFMSAKSPRNIGGYTAGNERRPAARTEPLLPRTPAPASGHAGMDGVPFGVRGRRRDVIAAQLHPAGTLSRNAPI